jgi:hypothetical protein
VGIEFLRKLINQADLLTKVVQGLNQILVNRGTTSDSGEIVEHSIAAPTQCPHPWRNRWTTSSPRICESLPCAMRRNTERRRRFIPV